LTLYVEDRSRQPCTEGVGVCTSPRCFLSQHMGIIIAVLEARTRRMYVSQPLRSWLLIALKGDSSTLAGRYSGASKARPLTYGRLTAGDVTNSHGLRGWREEANADVCRRVASIAGVHAFYDRVPIGGRSRAHGQLAPLARVGIGTFEA